MEALENPSMENPDVENPEKETAVTITPVMVIEVLDTHGRSQAQHRLEGVGVAYKIGRGLTCDIVLDDAHVAIEHTTLTLLDDGRVVVTDLSSRNGTRVGLQRLSAAATTIEDGQLIIGRTHVRVRTLHTALLPEKLFRRDIVQRYRTLLAVAGLALLVGYATLVVWQQAPEEMARNIFLAVAVSLASLGVWIGLWAMITRVSHGAWTLRMHVAIAANATALALWSSWLFAIAVFATRWEWLAIPAGIVAVTAILGALYLHLRKATHLSPRRAAVIAVTIPLALGGIAAWTAWQGTARNVNRQALGADLYPPHFRIAASTDLNEYLSTMPNLKRDANRKRQQSLVERPIADPGD